MAERGLLAKEMNTLLENVSMILRCSGILLTNSRIRSTSASIEYIGFSCGKTSTGLVSYLIPIMGTQITKG